MAVALNLATAPAAHAARLDAQQRRARRGHVITQHGLMAMGPLNGPQVRLHRTQGRESCQSKARLRTAPLLERRAYARCGYEALNQRRADSLRLSTATPRYFYIRAATHTR